MAPLRVLCIHGYRQNGSSFREKTGALRKLLKKQLELVYITAPLTVRTAATEGGSFLKETLQNKQLNMPTEPLYSKYFSFCYVTTTNFTLFSCDFMWQTNTQYVMNENNHVEEGGLRKWNQNRTFWPKSRFLW